MRKGIKLLRSMVLRKRIGKTDISCENEHTDRNIEIYLYICES